MNKTVRVVALASVVALAAAGCGSKPTSSSSGSATASGGAAASSGAASSPAANAFHACMVSDSGGIDDRSFNATAWKGMQDAQKELGVKSDFLESKTNGDYVPNINKFLQQNCGIIVTVGFLMGDATKAAAEKNTNQKFSIVDVSYDKEIPNLKPLVFNTAQAAFLGGYLAAGMTKTGKVATFGGIKIPPVTIYMDGFAEGVDYYNKAKGKSVKVLGWDEKAQNGSFTGDFEDQNKGKQLTSNFLQQGADIVFPVAGPVGLGAAAAVKASNGQANMLWVDTDGCVSAPQYCSLFISSVTKGIDVAVKDAVKAAKDGSFDGKPFIGNLENGGAGLAPFHDFESKVPAELKTELDKVKQDIISGKITIKSPAQPKA